MRSRLSTNRGAGATSARTPARVLAVTTTLAFVVGAVTPAAPARARALPSADRQAADCLTWAPPPLDNPVTIQLGTGPTSNVLDDNTDYIVELPDAIKTGRTQLTGGRNIVIIGGQIRLPSNPEGENGANRAIHIKDNTGTVHIEGVLIDAVADGQGDGVTINAPDSIVQIQNTRIINLKGGVDQFHADVIQPWGGVRELRVDKLTGTSDYQGLFLRRDLDDIGTVTVKRTNLLAQPELYPGAGGGYMLWISPDGTNSTGSGPFYNFSDLYVNPRTGRSIGKSVWPDRDDAQNPVVVDEGGFAHWPTLSNVTGGVQSGPPPGGSFVPAGVAGLNYTSPGYC